MHVGTFGTPYVVRIQSLIMVERFILPLIRTSHFGELDEARVANVGQKVQRVLFECPCSSNNRSIARYIWIRDRVYRAAEKLA